MRSSSVVGSRSVALRRHEPPPTSRADERELADERAPPLPGRAINVLDERTERTPQRQLVADRLRKLERLDDLRRRAPPAHARRSCRLSPGPRRAGRPAPIVRPRRHPGARQAVRHACTPSSCSSARRRGSIGTSSSGSGARKSLRRSSETTKICPGARRSPRPKLRTGAALRPHVDPRQSRRRRARACSAGSSPPYNLSRPHASRNRREPTPAGSTAEARVLERTQDLFPRLLGRGRVLLDEHELAGRSRAPRRAACPAGRRAAPPAAVTGPSERLRSGHRRERRRPQREPRLLAQRRPQLEAGDEEAGDHGNVCSTRTLCSRQVDTFSGFEGSAPWERTRSKHPRVWPNDPVAGIPLARWFCCRQGFSRAPSKTITPCVPGRSFALPLILSPGLSPPAPRRPMRALPPFRSACTRMGSTGVRSTASPVRGPARAIRLLQKRAHLTVDGVVGPKTRRARSAASPSIGWAAASF